MTATRTEGPRAPLFCWVLLFAPATIALAQTVELAELERCAALEADAQKLACFEAILASHGVARPAEAEPPDELRQGGLQAAPPPEAQAAATLDAEPDSAAAAVQPAAAGRDAVPAGTVSDREVAEASPEPAAPLGGWGFDEQREPELVHASVVKVTKTRYGELVFHFDDGQVWRQQEKRYFPYPKNREFDVTISTGMMGEYRLQVEGAGRKATIRRLQ